MNRDFEFKQLLRAYRSGIINEATFEKELADMSGESVTVMAAAASKRWARPMAASAKRSWRCWIVSGQARPAAKPPFRMGKAGHHRMYPQRDPHDHRARRLSLARSSSGGWRTSERSARPALTDFGRQVTEKLSDSKMSDNDKLLYITSLAPDPDAFWKPVSEFVDRIKDDQESKELFKLYIQDELSSGKWLMYACEALNGPAKAPTAQMGVSANEVV